MSVGKIRDAATATLVNYVGIAAGFVVNSSIAEVEKFHPYQTDPALFEMYFFLQLSKTLPAEVPYATVKEAIYKALNK